MACRAALLGQLAVHQCVSNSATPWLCTWRCSKYSLTRHARRGEITGRAGDGSDSYSCIWRACGCMRLSYQRGEQL
jgi:hypothetical protein